MEFQQRFRARGGWLHQIHTRLTGVKQPQFPKPRVQQTQSKRHLFLTRFQRWNKRRPTASLRPSTWLSSRLNDGLIINKQIKSLAVSQTRTANIPSSADWYKPIQNYHPEFDLIYCAVTTDLYHIETHESTRNCYACKSTLISPWPSFFLDRVGSTVPFHFTTSFQLWAIRASWSQQTHKRARIQALAVMALINIEWITVNGSTSCDQSFHSIVRLTSSSFEARNDGIHRGGGGGGRELTTRRGLTRAFNFPTKFRARLLTSNLITSIAIETLEISRSERAAHGQQ